MASDDLAFTIAIDPPGSLAYTTMARMLVSSLHATGFDGTIAILSQGDVPVARHAPPNLVEHRLPVADPGSACDWKFQARTLFDATRYRRVLYLDCDCLVIDDVRPLLEGDWDLAVVPEYGAPVTLTYFNAFLTDDEMRGLAGWGVNAGTFATRGAVFDEVAAEWERVMARRPARPAWRGGSDQSAWNRVVLDTSRRVHALAEGTVELPFVRRRAPPADATSRIVHFAGVPAAAQLQAMCERFFALFGVAPSRSP